MVVQRVNKTLFTCVAADTKPTTGIIGSALALESDTGKVFWTIDSGTTWTAASTAVASLIGSIILTSQVTGTLPVANGGTGAATLTGVLKGNGTSAVTAAAQLAVADGGTGAATLTGILKGNGTSAFTALTDPLPIANGGTSGATAAAGFDALSGLTTLGDILYGGASGTRTRLAGNLTSSKKFLSQQGTGAASVAPSWAVDPVFPSSGRKWGLIQPVVSPVAASSVAGQMGTLDIFTSITGTVAAGTNSTDGTVWTNTTAASNPSAAGWRTTNNTFYRKFNPRLKFSFKMDSLTAAKSVMGFKVSAAQQSTDDPANASSMAAFGFSSTLDATHWVVWTNDGSGATETTVTSITADTNYHTCEIVANDAGTKFTYSVDEAAPVDMISTIPASTTALCISFANVTTEAVAKNLVIGYVEIESDK